jgi:hypothetical protein
MKDKWVGTKIVIWLAMNGTENLTLKKERISVRSFDFNVIRIIYSYNKKIIP